MSARPRRRAASLGGPVPLLVLLAAVAGTVGACAPASGPQFPPAGSSPAPAIGATDATARQVVTALAAIGVQASESIRAYRPPEGALLSAAPRTVIEAPLTRDPDPAWIVVYALGSPDAARSAAANQATYIASNTGGIQFPTGTQFVLRVVGSTVVFYSWLPAGSPDPQSAAIAGALGALGDEVTIAR